jgi:type IV pilus assembly protein PilB
METEKPRVLCVDDDPNMLQWMSVLLNSAGYEVKTVSSAVRALVLARTTSPDVILLDVSMPEMDGYTLCERIHESPEAGYVPIVFVTGLGAKTDRSRAFLLGAAGYLDKPLKEQDLLRVVAAQVRTRRSWNEVRKIASGARKPESTPASEGGTGMRRRWDDRFRANGFARFKDFLVSRLKLPADVAKLAGRWTPAALYSGAAELGIPARQAAKCLAEFLELAYVPEIDAKSVKLGVLPTFFCLSNRVLPLAEPGGAPVVVLSNPFSWEVLEAVRRIAEEPPVLVISEPASFEAAFPPQPAAAASIDELQAEVRKEFEAPVEAASGFLKDVGSGPLVQLVNRLIEAACEAGASDIHVEPSEEEVLVRYRIDGDLHEASRLRPAEVSRRIIARLKVMANLDLAEHRLPQDGRIDFGRFSQKAPHMDLRVAILPVKAGEKACLRLIDRQKSVLPLDQLGFAPENLRLYREKIRAPHGMILHVGPTGSGKSMSLYAALNEIRSPQMNIQTAEDPIEYTLPGINQLQVNAEIGLTFGRALRSFLRADPDVILVGEIRDLETAKMAIEASLTGHLLLSTLHTNDAASTVTRFVEMGIEPYLVGSSLLAVCAQRLLRKLCPECREAYAPEAEERRLLGLSEDSGARLYRPKGCDRCGGIGYRGRTAVHEILVPNLALRQAALGRGVSSEDLKRIAVEQCGMTTLFQDAMRRVRAGTCSLADALANVSPDEQAPGRPVHGGAR